MHFLRFLGALIGVSFLYSICPIAGMIAVIACIWIATS